MYFIHTKRKMMMKELSREEILEVNGGVAQLAGEIFREGFKVLTLKIIEEGYKEVIRPAVENIINSGSVDRSEAWEKYCPKCC